MSHTNFGVRDSFEWVVMPYVSLISFSETDSQETSEVSDR